MIDEDQSNKEKRKSKERIQNENICLFKFHLLILK